MSASDPRRDALRRAADRIARCRTQPTAPDGTLPLWNAAFFGLDRVACFGEADTETRQSVLADCAASMLAESWHIERCGIEYCARMTLTAEDDDERRLFALIGADEARHAGWLAPWLAPGAPEPDPFNRFIAGLAATGTPQALAFLLQVVLEGFGTTHYSALAAHCRDAGLADVFQRLSRDEALHHAAGLAAFRPDGLTPGDRRFLADATQVFLEMIRCGPQAVVAALDKGIGLGDQADVAATFAAIDAGAAGAAKLARLRRLMAQPGMAWLVDTLAAGGLFTPCPAPDCARIYTASR
jgi:rubrerythrin